MKREVNSIIRSSVEYAMINPSASKAFVKHYAQALDDAIIRKHIELYVNNFSVNLGDDGKTAIIELYKRSYSVGFLNNLPEDIFID